MLPRASGPPRRLGEPALENTGANTADQTTVLARSRHATPDAGFGPPRMRGVLVGLIHGSHPHRRTHRRHHALSRRARSGSVVGRNPMPQTGAGEPAPATPYELIGGEPSVRALVRRFYELMLSLIHI